MRANIFDALLAAMHREPNVFLLVADMGIQLVERFEQAFPRRFLNVGIAEQNLVGIAAGLCNLGFRPFAYTISNFLIHRAFEQIRNDVALHGYPVTLLGTSAGYDNAPLGPTHHIVDDWGALRAIPGVAIYCPSSVACADALVDRLLERNRPAYVRIHKGAFREPASTEDVVYQPCAGAETLLVSYGATLQHCLEVRAGGEPVSILALNRLWPLEDPLLGEALGAHRRALVVEDQFASSGLYNALCQFAMERGLGCRIRSAAPSEGYALTVGSTDRYYHARYGLDQAGIRAALAAW